MIFRPVFSALEPWYFRRYFETDSCHNPIFIIAAPRTGSTILYQILTNNNEVLYVDNLASAFHKTMPFGIWLSQLIYKKKPHKSFQSNYGNTSSLHSPSESQSFWFRWFPRDRDFVEVDDIDHEQINDLRKTITSMMNHHGKDILFKNLACGQRIQVLQKAFPNAKFVFLKRDPVYTAQSLLLARRHLGIHDDVWWSVKPREFTNLNNLPIHEKLIQQILQVEAQVSTDLESVSAENKIEISYEDLPSKLSDLQAFLGLVDDSGVDLSALKFTNKVNASELDWKFLGEAYNQVNQTKDH